MILHPYLSQDRHKINSNESFHVYRKLRMSAMESPCKTTQVNGEVRFSSQICSSSTPVLFIDLQTPSLSST